MEFCDRIKKVRKQICLSQTAFAKELGIAQDTLIRREKGEFKPNYDAMMRFERYCQEKQIITK